MIPVSKPYLPSNVRYNVDDCIQSTWISSKGDYIEQFEKEFATFLGVKYAVAVNNGTAACHLAILCSGDFRGKRIAVPTLTFVATANAVTYVGAKPVFIDADLNSWNMNIDDLKSKISNCDAVFCVHLLGNPENMHAVGELCQKYNIPLIEDACEALGAKYNNQMIGSFGKCAAFSFFGSKTITTGEGGMLVTNDDQVYELAKLYRGQGQTAQYYHEVVGYNYRMTNLEAAIGCAQMENLSWILQERQRVFQRYYDNLYSLDDIDLQETDQNAVHSNWMVGIKCKTLSLKNKIDLALRQGHIETRPMFVPMHNLPIYNHLSLPLINAELLSWTVIMLPTYPQLTNEQIDLICRKIRNA